MHWIDWAILLGLLAFLTVMAIYTKQFLKSVADFLAANRAAGRYLIAIAQGEAGWGALTIIAVFEMFYRAGFTVEPVFPKVSPNSPPFLVR